MGTVEGSVAWLGLGARNETRVAAAARVSFVGVWGGVLLGGGGGWLESGFGVVFELW